MTPWRTIETALVAELKEQGFRDCIRLVTTTGDTIVALYEDEINLTTLAKSIADRINSEAA